MIDKYTFQGISLFVFRNYQVLEFKINLSYKEYILLRYKY